MGCLTGKKALIVGVASNRSIAWGIAESMAANGCEVAFTYQTEKLKGRVEKCAEICNSSIVIPCDVSSDEQIQKTFAELKKSWDSFDMCLLHSYSEPNLVTLHQLAGTEEGSMHLWVSLFFDIHQEMLQVFRLLVS